jgi:hypothetical protein
MSKQSTLTVGTLSLISETHRLLDGLSSDHDFEKFIPQTLRAVRRAIVNG